jgi:MFS family permease
VSSTSSADTPASTLIASGQTPTRALSPGGPYARYALLILTIVYVINFIDRQILSILAEDIKADLGVSDAQMGFLYGTAFAIFYAIFGIPLARLADLWTRTRLIAIGLSLWSLMTTLSGMARSFPALAACRLGVGVGEATANPATYSLLSDYFPPSRRTLVISIFSSGGYIGLGAGVYLGAAILDLWKGAYPDAASAPFGLAGWQVAFFVVGLPGLLMSLLVAALREPVRGASENIVSQEHPQPFREAFREMVTIVPPLTLYGLWISGYRARGIALNVTVAVGIALMALTLDALFSAPEQWIALGVGVYVVFTWAQSLALRDPPTYRLLFRSRAYVLSAIGFPCLAFVSYGFSFWTAPLLMRTYGVSASAVGPYVGAGLALGGWAGVTVGGLLADYLAPRVRASRHLVGLISAALTLPCAALMLFAQSFSGAIVCFFLMIFFLSLWFGPCYSSVVDLVLPRMRAIATALMIFMATLLGLALGPFTIGRLSDGFVAQGATPAEGLRNGMLVCLLMLATGFVLIWLARRAFEHDVEQKIERARAAGEVI